MTHARIEYDFDGKPHVEIYRNKYDHYTDAQMLDEANEWERKHQDEKLYQLELMREATHSEETRETLRTISKRLYHHGEWVCGIL
jgi:hypothetical protein